MKDNKDFAKLLNIMREQGSKDNPTTVELAVMTSSTTCSLGDLPLEKDDLFINASLSLSKGDVVAVIQLADSEQYLILCKVKEA